MPRPSRIKLSFKDSRDLVQLPKEIESLEAEQKMLHARMAGTDYYLLPVEAQQSDQARNDEIDQLLLEKLERWTQLEERSKAVTA